MSTMTATDLRAAALDALDDAWHVYRRSQKVPFPADPGPFMRAQSKLWHEMEPHTRTDDSNPFGRPDVDAIEDAVYALVASVEWSCGPEAAAFVAGIEGGER
jgi:hypothetical protein